MFSPGFAGPGQRAQSIIHEYTPYLIHTASHPVLCAASASVDYTTDIIPPKAKKLKLAIGQKMLFCYSLQKSKANHCDYGPKGTLGTQKSTVPLGICPHGYCKYKSSYTYACQGVAECWVEVEPYHPCSWLTSCCLGTGSHGRQSQVRDRQVEIAYLVVPQLFPSWLNHTVCMCECAGERERQREVCV